MSFDADFETSHMMVPSASEPLLTSHTIPPNHFLSIARRSQSHYDHDHRQQQSPTFDTSTVVAADFDIDPTTGFMPPHSPVVSLPGDLALWEVLMRDAMDNGGLVLGKLPQTELDAQRSQSWRERVERVSVRSA